MAVLCPHAEMLKDSHIVFGPVHSQLEEARELCQKQVCVHQQQTFILRSVW